MGAAKQYFPYNVNPGNAPTRDDHQHKTKNVRALGEFATQFTIWPSQISNFEIKLNEQKKCSLV